VSAPGEDRDQPPRVPRLDPDLAGAGPPASTAPPPVPPTGPAPVIDTRRYRMMVGVIGLVLVVAVSVYQFVTHGFGTSTGVPPGHRLHLFAAPLADTTLVGDPNPHPACTSARHDPRALNVCLMVKRGPLVLAFFVIGAPQCVRQVDALQSLSARFSGVQFAAVAVGAGRAATASVVRRRRWTIPVAYDRDAAVQGLYGVVACPLVELAAPGGIVTDRLIGDRWQTAGALAPYVRRVAATAAR
jgi:peroxiredoxin